MSRSPRDQPGPPGPCAGGSRLNQWVEQSAASDDYWIASPTWKPSTPRRVSEGELVVWADLLPAVFGKVAAALAVHFDGATTLSELADDLAAVTGASKSAARAQVAVTAFELATIGALEGLPVVAPLTTSRADVLSAEPGAELEFSTDGQGRPIVIQDLPDGTRRMTMAVQIGAGPAGLSGIDGLVSGERSIAEMVPLDSCLGSKLRNVDDVPLLSVKGVDGVVRSVRCHDPLVENALRDLIGNDLLTSQRGRIDAFVVTPLEGVGPNRVYDGAGVRRGRPRTPQESAELVNQLLGETAALTDAAMPGGPVPLELGLLTKREGPSVLIPLVLLAERGVPTALRAAGWSIGWQRSQVQSGGALRAPTAGGSSDLGADVVIAVPAEGDLSLARQVSELVGYVHPVPRDRAEILDRLVNLAARARWVTRSSGSALISSVSRL